MKETNLETFFSWLIKQFLTNNCSSFRAEDPFTNAFFLFASMAPIIMKIPPFSIYNKKMLGDVKIAMSKISRCVVCWYCAVSVCGVPLVYIVSLSVRSKSVCQAWLTKDFALSFTR